MTLPQKLHIAHMNLAELDFYVNSWAVYKIHDLVIQPSLC